MRSSTVIAALLAVVVAATPVKRDVEERAIITRTHVVTVTHYATKPEHAQTATDDNGGKPFKGHPIHHSSAVVTTVVPVPKPVETKSSKSTTTADAVATENVGASTDQDIHWPSGGGFDGQSAGSLYAKKIVWHHNMHRQNHSAPLAVWNQTLHEIAAEHTRTCIYEHDQTFGGGGYGQNIAAGTHADNVSAIITGAFYNGEMPHFWPFYGEPTPHDMSTESFDKFGHFTQMVWVDSISVGCATKNCSSATDAYGHLLGPAGLDKVSPRVPPYFTVCNYHKSGNWLGSFDQNIHKPLGMRVIHWDSYPCYGEGCDSIAYLN